MNKIIKIFYDDCNFSVIKEEKNYYIFKDLNTGLEIKIIPINEDKVSIEFNKNFI